LLADAATGWEGDDGGCGARFGGGTGLKGGGTCVDAGLDAHHWWSVARRWVFGFAASV